MCVCLSSRHSYTLYHSSDCDDTLHGHSPFRLTLGKFLASNQSPRTLGLFPTGLGNYQYERYGVMIFKSNGMMEWIHLNNMHAKILFFTAMNC